MSYCRYCGAPVAPDARFCSSCGAPVEAEAVVPVEESAPAVLPADYDSAADYSVVLYTIGTCARSYADDLLEDILGYTNSEARQILRVLPTEIARLLTLRQAQYIAQALTEYGMQVVVLRGDAEIDITPYATGSVYNSDGSFLTGVLTALASITVANRIRSFRRWTRPSLLRMLFTPRYRWTPPRHVRHIQQRPPVTRVSAPAPRRQSLPRKLEQPRRSGDVIRGVTQNRDNRGGIRSGGTGRTLFPGAKAPSAGSRPTGSGRGPGGSGRGPGGPGGSRGGGHGGPGGRH